MIELVGLDKIVPTDILDSLSDGAVMEVLQNIADAARNEWLKAAKRDLTSTRRDYISGLQPVWYQPGRAVISLTGHFPNMIERGIPNPINMHDTMLGSRVPVAPQGTPGKRRGADGGFYRSIPFRHTTPGSGGAVGAPMGRAYEGHQSVSDAKALGRKIYDMARGLTATKSEPGKGTAYGGRLQSPRDVDTGKKIHIAPKLRPYHTTNIYEGMIRSEKTYKSATQSQYTTFRTIAVDSDGSPKGRSPWIIPSRPGKHFAREVNSFIQKIATKSFQAYVDALGVSK